METKQLVIDISVLAQEQAWANGCPSCTFGVTKVGTLTGAVSLYEERMVQAMRGEAEFCTCRAGHMARQYARKVYSAMTEDGRRLACEKVDVAYTEIMAKDAVDMPTFHGAVPQGEVVAG